jgi:hypothetical protein
VVLKGRGFSRAAKVLYLCHYERASARAESALQRFSAACAAMLFPTLASLGFNHPITQLRNYPISSLLSALT